MFMVRNQNVTRAEYFLCATGVARYHRGLATTLTGDLSLSAT